MWEGGHTPGAATTETSRSATRSTPTSRRRSRSTTSSSRRRPSRGRNACRRSTNGAWFADQRRRGFPTLVAIDRGEIVGVAAYGDFRDSRHWPGYRFTAELSIHVRSDRHGRGIGRLLMEELFARARTGGIHVLVAAVDAGNTESIAFHERLGFAEVARMPETGFKFGRWLDLVLMQRVVGP